VDIKIAQQISQDLLNALKTKQTANHPAAECAILNRPA
jgi:hypothetical protein